MHQRSTLTRRFLLRALALALVLAAPACAAATPAQEATPTSATEATTTSAPTTPRAESTSLRLRGDTTVHTEPSDGAPVVTELAAETELGSATTLLVLDARDDWLHVLLPVRPNGASGWVRAASGQLRSTGYLIEVDLGARLLHVFEGDRVVLTSPIAVGAPDTPTPTGRFSVTDLVDTGDPNGAYGPFAIGLSAHSDQLTEFAGGDGQVGIHGTNQPASIGQAVSHGCVRLPNEVVAQLVELVPLGTPVLVQG